MPREHLLLNFRGTIGNNAAETFSVSTKLLRVLDIPFPSAPVAPSTVIAAGNAFAAYFSDVETHVNAICLFTETRGWFIGEDGRAKSQITTTVPRVPSVAGGDPGTIHPFQCALKVTLGAGHDRKGSRGGWYLPLPELVIDADGMITETTRDQIVGTTLEFIAALEAIPEFNDEFVVGWPSTSPQNPDGWALAERVSVGKVMDTLRSRRRDLDEAREWTPIVRS